MSAPKSQPATWLAGLLLAAVSLPAAAQSYQSLPAIEFQTVAAEWISEYVEMRGDFRAEAAVASNVPAAIVDRHGRSLVRLDLARTPAETLIWLRRNGCERSCSGLIFRGQIGVSASTQRPALMLHSVTRPQPRPAAPAAAPAAPAAPSTPAAAPDPVQRDSQLEVIATPVKDADPDPSESKQAAAQPKPTRSSNEHADSPSPR